jgi:hypothetical protein
MDNESLRPVLNSEETRTRALVLHGDGIYVDGGVATSRYGRGLCVLERKDATGTSNYSQDLDGLVRGMALHDA